MREDVNGCSAGHDARVATLPSLRAYRAERAYLPLRAPFCGQMRRYAANFR